MLKEMNAQIKTVSLVYGMNWEAKKVPRKEIQGGSYMEARERERRDVLSSCGQETEQGMSMGFLPGLGRVCVLPSVKWGL